MIKQGWQEEVLWLSRAWPRRNFMAFDVASLVAVWAAAWCRASKWVAMVVVGVGSAAQGADRMDFTENFPCGCDSVVSSTSLGVALNSYSSRSSRAR